MKIALAHDYLNQWGGAERVLEVLTEIFPEAPVYTLMYDPEKTLGNLKHRVLPQHPVLRTSFLDFSYARKNHRQFIPLMPLAARFLKIPEEYDLVISSSAGFAKGFNISKKTKHIAYTHTPLRYAWESDSYLQPITNSLQLKLYKPLLSYLKNWDFKAGQKPNLLIANSEFISGKIKKYYGRDSQVIYPPVDLAVFFPNPSTRYARSGNNSSRAQSRDNNYFLAIGRFLHYKKFDLVIETFNKLGLPLKIVGAGPEEEKLKNMVRSAGHSKPRTSEESLSDKTNTDIEIPRKARNDTAGGLTASNIEFLPFIKDQNELRALYQNARATIFPQVEDFGLVAAESIACGTPVIAFHGGGAKEIVNKNSGVLFREQTVGRLICAIQKFVQIEESFVPETVATEAKKFGKAIFKEKLREIIKTTV